MIDVTIKFTITPHKDEVMVVKRATMKLVKENFCPLYVQGCDAFVEDIEIEFKGRLCQWCGRDIAPGGACQNVHCDSKAICPCGASIVPGSGGRCTNGDCSNSA